MHEIKDGLYVRLAHVSAVGAVAGAVGRPGTLQFMVYLLGGQSIAIKGEERELKLARHHLLASLEQLE
jgi:hypothetical protein